MARPAPAKLLDLLSPTTAKYALAWRKRCRDNAARNNRRLKPGDTIRFATPLRFADGSEGQTFRVRTMEDLAAMASALDRLEPNPSTRPPVAVARALWVWPAGLALIAALALGLVRR